eukprot:TRINITY_DN3998_c0_g1_i14.p1 TRINITY_DN3998_c0_g1~~TRINITY_DN3998_c0_g1_i14.p1  ORF type:complete len:140 (-),score=4.84 TRINITY_DN3998_c0_g1_i14:248-667(-)
MDSFQKNRDGDCFTLLSHHTKLSDLYSISSLSWLRTTVRVVNNLDFIPNVLNNSLMWSTFLKCEVTTVIDPLVILYAPSNLNLYNTSSQSNTYDLSHPSLRPKTSLKLIQSCKTEVAHLIMYPYPHQSSFLSPTFIITL